MRTQDDIIIDHMGGTSKVAQDTDTPVSTVHSWRKNGIPKGRLAHLRLVAKTQGKPLPDDLSELADSQADQGAAA